MSATVQCIRCNKTIPTSEAQRTISGFEHCPACYEEVINPKPGAAPTRTPITLQPTGEVAPTETRAVLVDIKLGVGEWFSVIFKFTIASFLVGLVLAIPVFIIMAMIRGTSVP